MRDRFNGKANDSRRRVRYFKRTVYIKACLLGFFQEPSGCVEIK